MNRTQSYRKSTALAAAPAAARLRLEQSHARQLVQAIHLTQPHMIRRDIGHHTDRALVKGKPFAQDAATSAVWGMPRAVAEAGLATAVLPPDQIAARLAAMTAAAQAVRA